MTKDFVRFFLQSCCIVPLDVLTKAYIGGVKCNSDHQHTVCLMLCSLGISSKAALKEMVWPAFACLFAVCVLELVSQVFVSIVE